MASLTGEERKAQKKLALLTEIRKKAESSPVSTVQSTTVVQLCPDLFSKDHWANKAKADLDEKSFNALTVSAASNDFWETYKNRQMMPRQLKDVAVMFGQINSQLDQMRHFPSIKIYRNMSKNEMNSIVGWGKESKIYAEYIGRLLGGDGSSSSTTASSAAMGAGPEAGADEHLMILRDLIIPVKNHLADLEQALGYAEAEATMAFTMKPGAHELMFTPHYMAILPNGKGAAPLIAASSKEPFPEARQGEGNLPGYLGLKSEKNGKVSLSLSDSTASRLLFQWFVQSVEEYKPAAAPTALAPTAPVSGNPAAASEGRIDESSLVDASDSSSQTGTQAEVFSMDTQGASSSSTKG